MRNICLKSGKFVGLESAFQLSCPLLQGENTHFFFPHLEKNLLLSGAKLIPLDKLALNSFPFCITFQMTAVLRQAFIDSDLESEIPKCQ